MAHVLCPNLNLRCVIVYTGRSGTGALDGASTGTGANDDNQLRENELGEDGSWKMGLCYGMKML